jgi:hypothetical protein
LRPPEIDVVEITCQNSILAQLLLQPESDHRLLDFPFPSAVALEIEDFDELLGDGASALDHFACAKVYVDRANGTKVTRFAFTRQSVSWILA